MKQPAPGCDCAETDHGAASEVKKENQLSFLFICHDLALVQLFCDRVIVMHDGHVEEEGTPEEIIEHPKTEYTEQLIRSVL